MKVAEAVKKSYGQIMMRALLTSLHLQRTAFTSKQSSSLCHGMRLKATVQELEVLCTDSIKP